MYNLSIGRISYLINSSLEGVRGGELFTIALVVKQSLVPGLVTSESCARSGHIPSVTSESCARSGHIPSVTSESCARSGHIPSVTSESCGRSETKPV